MIDSDAVIVLLVSHSADVPYMIEMFYDLGMRRGDLMFIGVEWLNIEILSKSTDEVTIKVKELLKGAIEFFPSGFIGEVGTMLWD